MMHLLNFLLIIVYLLTDFGLMIIIINQLLTLTDLEYEDVNPFESVASINKWVLPEFGFHGMLCLLFLLGREWVLLVLAVPIACYHAWLYFKRQHLIDVTEVFRNLKYEKYYRMIKIGFYTLLFSIILIRFTLSAFNFVRNEVGIETLWTAWEA